MSRMSGIVLVFIRQKYQSQREKISGIYSAAIERGWQIQPVDGTFDATRFRELRNLWSPIGCLVDDSAMPRRAGRPLRLAKSALLGVPTVLLGRDKSRREQVLDCSAQDGRDPALAAARTLRELGLGQFAFVGEPSRPSWSEERRRYFADAVRPLGFKAYGGADPATVRGQVALASFLRGLPRPFGVLLAADHLAMPFYSAVGRAGLTIGRDLFVLGVDNDEMICTSLSPALSSVHPNFFQSGRNAIGLLDRRLRNPDLPPQYVTYGTLEVVRRASTARLLADRRIAGGLAFIAEHGLERITAADVAASMNCCRRMAEKLFRKHTGESILGTLRAMRLEKAKSLLANTSFPVDAIPPMCGYDSLPHFKTYFRQQTGMTMRDWRKRFDDTSGKATSRLSPSFTLGT